MKNTLQFALLALVFCFSISVKSQTVSGTVLDAVEKTPIAAVTIRIKGTSKGTITDEKGRFSLNVLPTERKLAISFLGYESQEVIIGSKDSINVFLQPADTELDEVVITEHAPKKVNATLGYAVTTLSGEASGVSSNSKKRSKRKKTSETAKPETSKPVSRSEPTEASFGYDGAYDFEVKEAIAETGGEYFIDGAISQKEISSGQLTAGEVNDFSKWDMWEDISENVLDVFRDTWSIYPENRFTVQLKTIEGKPLVDAQLNLVNDENEVLWSSRTDNTGKAELWANIFAKNKIEKGEFRLEAIVQNEVIELPSATLFKDGINVHELPFDCAPSNAVDIAFVVDATGSMKDEINYLKAELHDVIQRAKDSLPELDVNLGSVFYRDRGDQYLTRKSDFSANLNSTISFIQGQYAAGGGDTPEAVDTALEVAVNHLAWRESARARILFLVLDAPPHAEDIIKLQKTIKEAAIKGIRIVPVTGSGIYKSAEYLMRSIALATNGTYVFLTDDSGIGDAHIEPTTDSYDVELLNDLLIRLIYQYTHVPDCEVVEDALADIPDDMEPKIAMAQKREAGPEIDSLSWNYYPNPTSGPVTIDVEGKLEWLYVVDLSGKILERHEVRGKQQLQVNLGRYAEGIYFLKGQNDKGGITGKVILLNTGGIVRK